MLVNHSGRAGAGMWVIASMAPAIRHLAARPRRGAARRHGQPPGHHRSRASVYEAVAYGDGGQDLFRPLSSRRPTGSSRLCCRWRAMSMPASIRRTVRFVEVAGKSHELLAVRLLQSREARSETALLRTLPQPRSQPISAITPTRSWPVTGRRALFHRLVGPRLRPTLRPRCRRRGRRADRGPISRE